MAKDVKWKVEIDIEQMVWGDATVQGRFLLAQKAMDSASDNEDAQAAAMGDMIAAFDDMSALLDRVATVERDGERVPAKQIPITVMPQVMEALSAAQSEAANPKN